MDGKAWRLRRIVNPLDGRTVIVPLDHGVTVGPIPGLVSPKTALARICHAGPDAVIIHKGLVRYLPRDADSGMGLIIHLSAATNLYAQGAKALVTGVDDAMALGADGVSVHVNFSGPKETEMLADLGKVADRCLALGMPLLVMAYLRGGTLAENDPKGLAVAARACAELGADLVKLPWPGSVEAFTEIVAGCPVGVVVAGGDRHASVESLERRVETALAVGAAGVAAGRNVFQDSDPAAVLRRLLRLVHPSAGFPKALPLARSVGS
ncbi:MAG: fructose-bisphosphate aldolase [Desulfomonile tiedjei]|nr:fructose-bisphosphate aldolase [Desulfomonile tiedjei]